MTCGRVFILLSVFSPFSFYDSQSLLQTGRGTKKETSTNTQTSMLSDLQMNLPFRKGSIHIIFFFPLVLHRTQSNLVTDIATTSTSPWGQTEISRPFVDQEVKWMEGTCWSPPLSRSSKPQPPSLTALMQQVVNRTRSEFDDHLAN